MMVYYWAQNAVDEKFSDPDSVEHTIIKALPSIIYSFIIIPLNLVYKYVSILLTNWGN